MPDVSPGVGAEIQQVRSRSQHVDGPVRQSRRRAIPEHAQHRSARLRRDHALALWPEAVEYLQRFPYIEWLLVTNLSLNNDATWDRMIRSNFFIGLSMDGGSQETFETIRRGGRFDKTLHNLGVLRDARRRHGRGYLHFISTIQRSNAHEMRKLVELAHTFEIPEVGFKMVRGDPFESDLRLGVPELSRYAEEALAAGLDLDVRVTFNDPAFTRGVPEEPIARASQRLPQAIPASSFFSRAGSEQMQPYRDLMFDAGRVSVNQRCFKPFSFILVNHDTEVGTCNHMMEPGMLQMGDLKAQSLAEVWNGPAYQDFRRQLTEAAPQDERCQWCFAHRLED